MPGSVDAAGPELHRTYPVGAPARKIAKPPRAVTVRRLPKCRRGLLTCQSRGSGSPGCTREGLAAFPSALAMAARAQMIAAESP